MEVELNEEAMKCASWLDMRGIYVIDPRFDVNLCGVHADATEVEIRAAIAAVRRDRHEDIPHRRCSNGPADINGLRFGGRI